MSLALSGCLAVSPTVLDVYNGGKQRITCQLIHTGGGANSVTQIDISGDARLSIVSIAGTPYTGPTAAPLPFSLDIQSAPVPIVLEVDLTTSTIGDTFSSTLNVTASGGGGTFSEQYDFQTIDPAGIVTGNLNLGFVPVGMSNSKILTFTNNSAIDLIVDVTNSCDFPNNTDLTVNQPDPFVVLAGGVVNWQLTWQPTISFPGVLDCSFQFGYAEGELEHTAFVTGNSSDLSDALSFNSIQIQTEGGFLPTATGFENPNLCDPYTAGAIGELKTIVFEINYALGFDDGQEIYFNPFLFCDDCDFARLLYNSTEITESPFAAYYVEYCKGMGTVPMKVIGIGTNENNNTNIQAEFVEVSQFISRINFTFYLTEDIDFPITDKTLPNRDRLLKNHINATNELINEVQGVYSVEKKIGSFFYFIDPNILVDGEPAEGFIENQIRVSFRFYNKGLFDKPGTPVVSEFTNPRFVYERNGNPVETLSIFDETEVTFTINAVGFVPDQAVAWLFVDTRFNDDLNFYDNYESSRAPIPTAGPGIIDNLIVGQSTAITPIGGDDYETIFKIDQIPLNLQDENFKLVVIVYDSIKNVVNSFINPI